MGETDENFPLRYNKKCKWNTFDRPELNE